METSDNIWNNYYAVIGFLNALIDQSDELTQGDPSELKRVKGRCWYIGPTISSNCSNISHLWIRKTGNSLVSAYRKRGGRY
ncbi:hypothetical protein KUH03_11155 [Sphingobacterium sp. E70]|uniref:hypothetical protein n=1 Tax=Sphingobacterium sp. E70 TaxID=2853439 RepID=UPI00211BD014|nr:hypothetical protein [Sphingobacterium sp. E70]ULT27257.1 hypothetical protein KUH03_11155 [Sphingobacterium sp. E70]